jgi:uncharacterized protein with FMN-binding domain
LRRALLTLGGTAAGLAALFSFKTHSAADTAAVAPEPHPLSASSTPSASPSPSDSLASPKASPSARKSPKPAKSPTPAAPATTKAPMPTAPATPPAATAKTYTGPNENTQYGPIDVRITVKSGKITSAADVAQPDDSIAQNAVSELNSEVVSAQSADVQAVSGATYTSDGYLKSLQSAVDQAGL